MIEVILSNGDRAECDEPEEAILAARTLLDDAWEANPVQGNHPTVTIVVDGKMLHTGLTRKDILSV